MMKKVVQYRQFIISCIRREFQSRYQRSMLGAAWSVLNPLAMIIVYTVIFSQIMKAKLPGVDNLFGYSIFLCAGILTWGLFTEIIGRCITVFLDNANTIKKLNFPRICLPITVIGTAVINFSIVFGLFLLFLLATGNLPGLVILAIVPVLMIIVLFSIGLGVALGVLNVFFRDIGQLMGIVLQFWFWATPVVYPPTILPPWILKFLAFNPMLHLIRAMQTIFVERRLPELGGVAVVAILSVAVCLFALRLYKNHVGEMVDEL